MVKCITCTASQEARWKPRVRRYMEKSWANNPRKQYMVRTTQIPLPFSLICLLYKEASTPRVYHYKILCATLHRTEHLSLPHRTGGLLQYVPFQLPPAWHTQSSNPYLSNKLSGTIASRCFFFHPPNPLQSKAWVLVHILFRNRN